MAGHVLRHVVDMSRNMLWDAPQCLLESSKKDGAFLYNHYIIHIATIYLIIINLCGLSKFPQVIILMIIGGASIFTYAYTYTHTHESFHACVQ